MKSRPRRFKIQRRVELRARDYSDKPFLLGVVWRTVGQADRRAVAEDILKQQKVDHPRREFRLAEEWPIGTLIRPLPEFRDRRERRRRKLIGTKLEARC